MTSSSGIGIFRLRKSFPSNTALINGLTIPTGYGTWTSWHNYGYGICVDDIKEHSVARLEELLKLAPELQARMRAWLMEKGISAPAWEDYMEYDTDYEKFLLEIS